MDGAPAEHGHQKPMTGIETELVADPCEREIADGAEADPACSLSHLQKLRDVTGLEIQIAVRILAIDRLDTFRLTDQVDLERRGIEERPVVVEVHRPIEIRGRTDALQRVLGVAIVVNAGLDSFDGFGSNVDVDLHGERVAGGWIET